MRGLRRVTSSAPEDDAQATRFEASPGPARVFQGGFYKRKILEKFVSQVPGAKLQHALAVVCGEATSRYLASKDGISELDLSARLQINVRNAGAHALSGPSQTVYFLGAKLSALTSISPSYRPARRAFNKARGRVVLTVE